MSRIINRRVDYGERAQVPAYGEVKRPAPSKREPVFLKPRAPLPYPWVWIERGPEFRARHPRTKVEHVGITEEVVLKAINDYEEGRT